MPVKLSVRLALLLALGWGATSLVLAQEASRAIAVTVDDLPAMSAMDMTAADITALNARLLAALKTEKVPVIGFVNEERLYRTGEVDARIAVLNSWLEAGFDLGNHTFSHTSLNHADLKDWEDDVVQGESVTRMLTQAHHKELNYLRHPYLDVGPDLQTRREAERFLTGRNYRIAPVTIDGRDWYFADLYQDARKHHDPALEQRISEAWLAYTEAIISWEESRCRDLLGYEPKQILLLHDTWLEADHIPQLLSLLRRHGYRFISLAQALTDPAYAQPDTYISDVGASWIDHWAVTRGRPAKPGEKPALPKWIEEKHNALDLDQTP